MRRTLQTIWPTMMQITRLLRVTRLMKVLVTSILAMRIPFLRRSLPSRVNLPLA